MEEENNTIPDNNELENLKKTCDEYLNGWKRAKADFINYQKDENKRFEEFAQFAHHTLIQDCILVLDSFNAAFAATQKANAETQQHLNGFRSIQTQLEDMLKKYGLETIAVQPKDAFNPVYHEAISVVNESLDGYEPNTIVEEMEKGYTLYGKVIRPARVKIIQ